MSVTELREMSKKLLSIAAKLDNSTPTTSSLSEKDFDDLLESAVGSYDKAEKPSKSAGLSAPSPSPSPNLATDFYRQNDLQKKLIQLHRRHVSKGNNSNASSDSLVAAMGGMDFVLASILRSNTLPADSLRKIASILTKPDGQKQSAAALLSPLNLRSFSLANRAVLAPLTRGRATEKHVPTEIMGTYYCQRATAGMMIAEGTGISPQGLGWYRAPGIWNKEQMDAWRPIVARVHEKKGLICLQLWHMGRQVHSAVTGQRPVAPSAIKIEGDITTNRGVKKPYETPKALSELEIQQVVRDFAQAAENAMNVGFDAVEIHGANGYLVDEFLQSSTNQRTDAYGGSIEKRLRFVKEIINAIIHKGIPRDRIGIRLSPNGTFGSMGSKDNFETFSAAIDWLTRQNLLYIHVMDGLGFGFHKLCEPFTLENARTIMDKVGGSQTALIGNVGYTKETADKAISSGTADMIAFGRPFIANADLVYRWQNDLELEKEAEYPTWWGWNLKEKGYIDWPVAKKL